MRDGDSETQRSFEQSAPMVRDAWKDFESRRNTNQARFHARSPKQIGNVLARLVNQRGYSRIRSAGEQEAAWIKVAGEELADLSQFSSLKRGTFEVSVANSLVMQELTFRKEEILTELQKILPDAGVKKLRFKVTKIAKS